MLSRCCSLPQRSSLLGSADDHHANHLWKSWSNLTSKVRGPEPAESPASAARNADEMRAFIGAMHVVGAPLAEKIVKAVEPGEARNLIDVGGASGTYTIAFLSAAPKMKATLFDRPAVIPIARERWLKRGWQTGSVLWRGIFTQTNCPADTIWRCFPPSSTRTAPHKTSNCFARCCTRWYPEDG